MNLGCDDYRVNVMEKDLFTWRTRYQDMIVIVTYHMTVLWGTVFKRRRRFPVAHGEILLTMPFQFRRSVVGLMLIHFPSIYACAWIIINVDPPVSYILESNPHPFYSSRGLKNQMRIRFAVVSWILEKWQNRCSTVRTIKYNNLLFYLLFIILYNICNLFFIRLAVIIHNP